MARSGVQKDDTVITFEKPSEEHLSILAASLDRLDETEILAGTGTDVHSSLTEAVAVSDECFTVMDDGSVLGVFGLAPCPSDQQTGFPWGFFTNTLRDLPFFLLKHSRQTIDTWNNRFPSLRVYVLADNKRSIYFLEWLGFSATSHVLNGQYNTVFLEYEKCATPL